MVFAHFLDLLYVDKHWLRTQLGPCSNAKCPSKADVAIGQPAYDNFLQLRSMRNSTAPFIRIYDDSSQKPSSSHMAPRIPFLRCPCAADEVSHAC